MFKNISRESVVDVFGRDCPKIGKKRIWPFHVDICYAHMKELAVESETTCKSGFIRQMIYAVLGAFSKSYVLEITGHRRVRTLCRCCANNRVNWTPGMILGFIKKGKILKSEVVDSQIMYEQSAVRHETTAMHTMAEIESLFGESATDLEKLAIVREELSLKWNIFEHCWLYRFHKKILLR
mgnify:FL=1